jgi:hypothetical protein
VNPLRISWIAGFLLACILFSGCTQETKPAGPKLTGRLIFLNGSGPNGSDLIELTPAENGAPNNLKTIASGVLEATPSADQTQLLYATRDAIILLNLQTAATTSVVKGAGFCLAWAPDGKRFSYQEKSGAANSSLKLFVSDLDGRSKTVSEDSSGVERAGKNCAQWIAPDSLLFDRFAGMVPKNAVGEKVKPNTTTIAVVGESIRFIDSARKWSVEGICPSGSAILTPADQSSPILIAKSLEHFEKLNPTPGPTEGRFIGFVAKSCVPFFLTQSISTASDLFSLNPTNWQRSRTSAINETFSPSAKFLIKSSARLMIAGDTPGKLLLIDTESGDVTPLLESGKGALSSPVPVVWIEN